MHEKKKYLFNKISKVKLKKKKYSIITFKYFNNFLIFQKNSLLLI